MSAGSGYEGGGDDTGDEGGGYEETHTFLDGPSETDQYGGDAPDQGHDGYGAPITETESDTDVYGGASTDQV